MNKLNCQIHYYLIREAFFSTFSREIFSKIIRMYMTETMITTKKGDKSSTQVFFPFFWTHDSDVTTTATNTRVHLTFPLAHIVENKIPSVDIFPSPSVHDISNKFIFGLRILTYIPLELFVFFFHFWGIGKQV